MKLFDTHTHLNAEQFAGEEAEVVQRAQESGVDYLCVVGFDEPTIEQSLALNQQFPHIISAIGWHPTEASRYSPTIERQLLEQLEQPKVHMLGEIGLDYHWDTSSPSDQQRVFRRQIAIAKEMNLPITIHNREATEDVYRILKEEGIPHSGGIMHSFGEDTRWMYQFLDLGMHISFSGVVTFKKTEAVRQVAREVPIERLLVETDAPYLAPVPYRGKRNESAYVLEVAKVIANVRDISLEELAKQTTCNAFELFRWYPEG